MDGKEHKKTFFWFKFLWSDNEQKSTQFRRNLSLKLSAKGCRD